MFNWTKSKGFERSYPFMGAALVSGCWWWFCVKFPEPADSMLNASLTFGAIITGFLGTSKAILMSLKGTKIFRRLYDSGFINDLSGYLQAAILSSLGFCLLSFAGFFKLGANQYFGVAWSFFGAHTVLSFWRIMAVLLAILKLDTRK